MSDDPACCAVKLLWVRSARESGDLDLPDVPCAPALLPVPGSSRTSEATPGPSYIRTGEVSLGPHRAVVIRHQ
ncbi:hypothetical protein CU666_14420 [Pseudomonas syringae pv. actinidifoliorum]|nr:hypothetical protein [Pseudomonas syringae pv. actinidifoliorum]